MLFPFLIEIIEGLLHGFPKPLPEPSWIEVEEFLVESTSCCLSIHREKSWKRAFFLIAVRNTQETWQLVNHEAAPEPCDEKQKSDSEQKGNGFRHNTISRSDGLNDWHENDIEYYWQDPQKAK